LASSPVDLAKTRIMTDQKSKYKGIFDCLVKTYKYEGFRGWYKGFNA